MKVGDVVRVGGARGIVTDVLGDEIVIKWEITTFTGRKTHHSAVYHISELKELERGWSHEPA